ncbi:MAG: hypothetical protein V8R70_02190 [Candidatus Gastranaerophilaceae bacterium]
MMKKLILLLSCILLQVSAAYAASQLHVVAMDEFKTDKPSKNISVRVLEPSELGRYQIGTNAVLNCQVLRIVDPKRGKRNATFFVKPVSYTDGAEKVSIEEEMYGKYSKFVLSKEELKKIPPFKVMKNAALMVGNYFIKGISIAYHFGEGFVKNEKENRFKSGVTNAYEESPLSYIGEGEQLDIKVGDDFYLVFKTEEDVEEPNYTYTPAEE